MAFEGARERLAFVVDLNSAGAERAFRGVGDAAERHLGRADGKLDRLGSSMQKFGGVALAGAGVAAAALVGFAKAADEAAIESGKLDRAIESSTDAAGYNRDALDELAASLQDTANADGDAITGMQGFLVSLGRTNDEVLALTPLVNDLAQRFGLDLTAAARLANTAIEGNASRLERLVGPIDDAALAADGFTTVLAALETSVGGTGEAMALTFGGQLEKLKRNLGDVAEGIGAGVVGAFNDLLGPVNAAADAFSRMNPATQSAIGKLVAFGTVGVGAVGAASLLAGTAIKMRTNFTTAGAALGLTATQMGKVATGAAAAGIAIGGLATAYTIWSGAMDAARDRVNEVADDIDDRLANDRTWEELTGNYDTLVQGIADVDAAHRGSSAPWDADARREMALQLDALREDQVARGEVIRQVRALSEEQGISLDQATRIVQATRNEEAAHAELVDTLGEEGAEEQELNDRTAAVEAAMSARAAATDEVVESMQALRDEQEAQNDALLSQLDLELQLRASQRQSEDAYAAYREAVEEFGRGSREAAEAEDALIEAHLNNARVAGEAAAANELAQGRISTGAAASRDAQVASLQAVLAQIGPNSPLRRAIEEHIWILASIPRNIGTDITVSGNGNLGPLSGARAKGGMVTAGKMYEVGEQGAELLTSGGRNYMIPGRDGTVTPNDRMKSGPTINVTMNGVGLPEVARSVGDEILWQLRTMVA